MTKKAVKKVAEQTQKVAESDPISEPIAPAPTSEVAAPTPEVEKVAVPPAPKVTPEQQRQIDRVMKQTEVQAREAIEAILGGNAVAGLGTPTQNEDVKQDAVQRDYIPGTRRRDPTYIPESIYDDRDGETRKVLDHNAYAYYLCPQEKFDSATGMGWKFVHFDGGSRSGLLGDGFQGTGESIFMRDLRGYCRRGDVYLMWTERSRYLEFLAEDREAVRRSTMAPIGDFANVAYGKGIRAMAHIDGEDVL